MGIDAPRLVRDGGSNPRMLWQIFVCLYDNKPADAGSIGVLVHLGILLGRSQGSQWSVTELERSDTSRQSDDLNL
jgi:hypothetical protein